MFRRYLIGFAAVLLGASVTPSTSWSAIISQPDAAYTGGTTLIGLGAIPLASTANAITDGNETVTFSSNLTKAQVPTSWSTWSSAPFSEGATPEVLFAPTNTSSLTITLEKPVSTFGFELEPNVFSTFSFVATFSNGDVINLNVGGYKGARLFASGGAGPITSVTIETTSPSFALARIRYGDVESLESLESVPEPASLCTWALLAGATGLTARLRRRT